MPVNNFIKYSLLPLIAVLSSCGGGGSSPTNTQDQADINNPGTIETPPVVVADPNASVVLDHTNFKVFIANDGQNGAELWTTNGNEADTYLLKQINLAGHSNPYAFYQHGSDTYFKADDGIHGVELWKYDGVNTIRMSDISPGLQNANPDTLIAFSGGIAFRANNGLDREIYITDGTAAGTKLLAGAANNYINPVIRSSSALNGQVYFQAEHSVDGPGIWKTDGQTYTQVLDETPYWSALYNNKLYFMVYDAVDPTKASLYQTDGTDFSLVQTFTTTVRKAYFSYVLNNKLLFIMNGPDGGAIWSYDGTVTTKVKNVNPTGQTAAYYYIETQGKLYFSGLTDTYGYEPWVTDGTTAGTHLIKDLNTIEGESTNFKSMFAAGSSIYLYQYTPSYSDTVVVSIDTTDDTTVSATNFSSISKPVAFNGFDYFIAYDKAVGISLYRQSLATPELIKTLEPVTQTNYLSSTLHVVNNKLLFNSFDSTNGNELWESDGTPAGTKMLIDLRPGKFSGIASPTMSIIANELFFIGNNGLTGDEFWSTDGTVAGTRLVSDINTSTSEGINNYETFEFKGKTYFFAADEQQIKHSLYMSDGTADGTLKVDNSYTYDPYYFVLSDKILFETRDPDSGEDFLVTDGTIGNAHGVIDMNPSGDFRLWSIYGNSDVFACIVDADQKVWHLDGTVAGTYTYTINNLSDFTSIIYIPVGNELVAQASDYLTGVVNMYRYDEIQEKLVPLVITGRVDSYLVLHGILYFDADNATTTDLWRTDGTVSGTSRVETAAGHSAYLSDGYKPKDWIYYVSSNDVVTKYWRYDGVTSQQLTGAEEIANIYDSVTVGDYNYLSVKSVNPSLNGWEIWRINSAGDAMMMINIESNAEGYPISNMQPLNNGFTFIAEDVLHGREMWISNGSESGTHILKDIYPGPVSSTRSR